MTRIALVVIAVLAVLAAPAPGAPDPVGEQPLPAGFVARCMARVEKIRGVPFAHGVPVIRATPRAYLDRMLGDVERLLGGPDTLGRLEILLRDLGQIGPGETVTSIARRFIPASSAASYDAHRERIEILRGFRSTALLCHELTHALDDQRFDLLAMFRDGELEFDRLLALGALIEGSAESVEMTVRTQGAFPLLPISILRREGETRAEAYVTRHRDVPRLLARAFIFQYLSGLVFVETAKRRRLEGWLALDGLFRRPPRTTEQVLHPEKYFAREGARALAPFRPAGWSVAADNVLGELGTIIALEGFGVPLDAARIAASGWGADRIAHLESPRGSGVFVWDTTWDSGTDAATFFSIARSGLRGPTRASDGRTAVAVGAGGTVDLLMRHGPRVTMLRGAASEDLGALRIALLDAIGR